MPVGTFQDYYSNLICTFIVLNLCQADSQVHHQHPIKKSSFHSRCQVQYQGWSVLLSCESVFKETNTGKLQGTKEF